MISEKFKNETTYEYLNRYRELIVTIGIVFFLINIYFLLNIYDIRIIEQSKMNYIKTYASFTWLPMIIINIMLTPILPSVLYFMVYINNDTIKIVEDLELKEHKLLDLFKLNYNPLKLADFKLPSEIFNVKL